MVTVSGICLALIVLGNASTEPLPLQCWVIEGTVEGRETPLYDARASQIRDALEDLPFDTFKTVYHQADRLAPRQEKRQVLTAHYTMGLSFVGMDDAGRARVVVTVLLAAKTPDKEPRKVVETTLLLSPRGKARVGGLRCESSGEMVIVLARE